VTASKWPILFFMENEDKRQEAMELVGKAYQAHMKGKLDEAIGLYTQSIELCPTAEAFTYRGWAQSGLKDYEAAIADCHRAIDLDPEFGNPYNDIGAYYLEMGLPEDAIPWLRMALKAKRYENYCFPHYNLGRIHEGFGRLEEALVDYRKSLDENPGFGVAAKAIDRVKAKLAALARKENP